MYGYRYTPGGRVFELPDLGLADATAEVEGRRARQSMHGSGATIELVTDDGDGHGWQLVLQPATESTPPQQAQLLGDDGDDVRRILDGMAMIPRRSGRSRRRR